MKSKMRWSDVVAIYGIPSEGKYKIPATKKGAIHKHNPAWKPAKAAMTPKQWHKANRKKETQ